MHHLGNAALLQQHKTAFLCSRTCPAQIILKSYDWAAAMRKKQACVISGFHSPIEQDVFHILLKGTQPIIWGLARGMKKRWEPHIKTALAQNRLLIISPFPDHITRITADTARRRNQTVMALADHILIAHARTGGMLRDLAAQLPDKPLQWGFTG